MHPVRHLNISLHTTKMTNSQDNKPSSQDPKDHDKAEHSPSPSDPDAITPAPRRRRYLSDEDIQGWSNEVEAADNPMTNSRPAYPRRRPGSGVRTAREEDAQSCWTDISDEQEMENTGDVRPQEPESSGQEAAAQDNQTPGEDEATVHHDERSPEGSAGPTGQAPPPRPRDPNLATPSISTAPSRMVMTFDSGRPELSDLDEYIKRHTPGSHPSLPDTATPDFSSESRSSREASVHDDLVPSGADLPSRDSHEAASGEASVPDDSAPPEANLPAEDSHEADSTEHVEGRSVSERPPTNSQNRQSPPPGRQGHDEAPVNQSTHSSSTPDSMAITPAPPLSSNDGDGSESDRSNVQGSHHGSVRSWNQTFDTFADQ